MLADFLMGVQSPMVTCSAIAGVVVLVLAGLFTGHDGTLLNVGVAAVAGLGGFSLARVLAARPPPK